MDYCSTNEEWVGRFVAGPHAGTTKRISVAQFANGREAIARARKWREDRTQVEGGTQGVKSQQAETKEFITEWCAHIANGKSDEFEERCCLTPKTDEGFATPAKKRCRSRGGN